MRLTKENKELIYAVLSDAFSTLADLRDGELENSEITEEEYDEDASINDEVFNYIIQRFKLGMEG